MLSSGIQRDSRAICLGGRRSAEHMGAEPGLIMAQLQPQYSTMWQRCLKNYTIITRFARRVVGEGESDCLISV